MKYFIRVGVGMEVNSDKPLSDLELEQEARERFFKEVETYKYDEVFVDVWEEEL